MRPRFKVGVVAYDDINPFHLSVPGLVFGATRDDPEAPLFEISVCAVEQLQIDTSAGYIIVASDSLDALGDKDLVCMPSWHDDCRSAPAPLLNALRSAYERGATVIGLCLGAFPLAEAGLLTGRTATTHWRLTEQLAARYPAVSVNRQALYVDQGDVLTSAGVAAGLDCCLHLLRRLAGAEVANRVARRLLVAPHRQGGQAQFIERPIPTWPADSRLTLALDSVIQHLDEEQTIDNLAARVHMSRRNFTRPFRTTMGTTFTKWLLHQRLAYAQRLLESSDMPVEIVAQQSGFKSGLSLRQNFQSEFKVSPSSYRRSFRIARPGSSKMLDEAV